MILPVIEILNRFPLLSSPFVRFSIVGGIGFLVDAAVLYAVIYGLDVGLLVGRLISYFAAATTTWYLNKVFTFTDAPRAHAGKQWAKFVLTNGIGGAVNYATYTLVVLNLPGEPWVPLVGVMLGSLAGLVFNYILSRRFVFGQSDIHRTGSRETEFQQSE